MADGIFHFGRQFSEGLVAAVRLEDRVVAETAIAARSEGDGTFDGAFKSFQNFAVESDRDGADEAGAAVGFAIVNMLNEDQRVAMRLSPVSVALVAFCFSMTIGVLWEFFEWCADLLLGLDMQKDTILAGISSVMLHPDGKNDPVTMEGIRDVILILEDGTQVKLGLGGYLDIGLMDTMKDLLVNLIGAVIFSFFGYFYVKTKGEGKIAKMFIPQVEQPEE